jgi:phage shock protein C
MEKKLYRSRAARVLGGVCGGLADYFNVDVTIIRVAWAIASLCFGTGVLAYVICVFLIPPEPEY